MAMTNSDKLHVEPTPMGWVAYYDPEGLNGHGSTREAALTELLDQTDECWRKALDERLSPGNALALKGEIRRLTDSLSEAVTFQLQARTAETLDAERYRYLRNAAGMCEAGPSVCSGLSDLFEYHWGPEVDEVVDEAIADWKARGCPLPKEAA